MPFIISDAYAVQPRLEILGPYDLDPLANETALRINDSGDLMWRGRGDLILDQSFNIYTRIGGTVEQVTDDDLEEYSPQISNNGHLVWEINDGEDDEIVFRLEPDKASLF